MAAAERTAWGIAAGVASSAFLALHAVLTKLMITLRVAGDVGGGGGGFGGNMWRVSCVSNANASLLLPLVAAATGESVRGLALAQQCWDHLTTGRGDGRVGFGAVAGLAFMLVLSSVLGLCIGMAASLQIK